MFRLKVVMPKTKINNQETTAKNINYRGKKATITCCQFWRYMNRIFSEQTLKNVHVPNSKMLNNVLFALKMGNVENVSFLTRLKWRNGHPLKRRQFRHFPWAKKYLPIQKSLLTWSQHPISVKANEKGCQIWSSNYLPSENGILQNL